MTEPKIYKDYIDRTNECKEKYGENTVVLMLVGGFFEVYGFKDTTTGCFDNPLIEEFASRCQLVLRDLTTQFKGKNVYLSGFRDYSLDNYLQRITSNGMTGAVFTQRKEGTTIYRELDAVYSPGTFVSYNCDISNDITNNIVCIWFHKYKFREKSKLIIIL